MHALSMSLTLAWNQGEDACCLLLLTEGVPCLVKHDTM